MQTYAPLLKKREFQTLLIKWKTKPDFCGYAAIENLFTLFHSYVGEGSSLEVKEGGQHLYKSKKLPI